MNQDVTKIESFHEFKERTGIDINGNFIFPFTMGIDEMHYVKIDNNTIEKINFIKQYLKGKIIDEIGEFIPKDSKIQVWCDYADFDHKQDHQHKLNHLRFHAAIEDNKGDCVRIFTYMKNNNLFSFQRSAKK